MLLTCTVRFTILDVATLQQQPIHRASSRTGRSALMERVQSFTEKVRNILFNL